MWESSDPIIATLPKVQAFVKAQGSRMAYHVAADTPDNRVAEALEGKNWRGLLGLTDKAIAKHPQDAGRYDYDRLVALFHVDPAAAASRSDEILKTSGGEVGAYQMVASVFASLKDLKSDAYRYGQSVVERALTKKDREYLFLAMGAEVAASLGDAAGAVRSQTRAVRAAETNSYCPKEFLLFLRKSLDRFTAATRR